MVADYSSVSGWLPDSLELSDCSDEDESYHGSGNESDGEYRFSLNSVQRVAGSQNSYRINGATPANISFEDLSSSLPVGTRKPETSTHRLADLVELTMRDLRGEEEEHLPDEDPDELDVIMDRIDQGYAPAEAADLERNSLSFMDIHSLPTISRNTTRPQSDRKD